ncbi:MAG: sulfatase-like hydrolase/transferase, partial [Armatimonadota bacterium]
DNHYTAGYPCSPSRASILTGRHTVAHGVLTNGVKLHESIPTFATELSRVGYTTCWMGKWHLGGPNVVERDERGRPVRLVRMEGDIPGETGPQNGFQRWVSAASDYVAYLREHDLDEPIPGEKVRGGHHTVIRDGHSVIPQEHFISAFLADQAVQFLRAQAERPEPFCLCVSFPGPHRPMTPPEPWDKMYRPEDMALPPNLRDTMDHKPRITHKGFRWYMLDRDLNEDREMLKKGIVFKNEMWDLLDRPRWTEREYKELMAHYYGFISYIDEQIGKILGAVDRLGLRDNTIVIFTTDHGEYMGGHGCIFKAMAMYEELMHVPLLIRYPGLVRAGTETDALTSSIDLMPTLLDLADVPIPDGVQGESLSPVLRGRRNDHHDAVFTATPALGYQIAMLRTRRHKFVLNWRPRQMSELYDLEADPLEMNNLAAKAQPPRVLPRLRKRLLSWMERAGDPLATQAKQVARLPLLDHFAFEFNDGADAAYWQPARGISGLRVEAGRLVGDIECPGYMVCSLDVPVNADEHAVVEIRMMTTAGENAQVYWTTSDSPQYAEDKSVRFAIVSDGRFHTYRFRLADDPLWAGKQIAGFRINPVRRRPGDPEGLAAHFEIDWIRTGLGSARESPK